MRVRAMLYANQSPLIRCLVVSALNWTTLITDADEHIGSRIEMHCFNLFPARLSSMALSHGFCRIFLLERLLKVPSRTLARRMRAMSSTSFFVAKCAHHIGFRIAPSSASRSSVCWAMSSWAVDRWQASTRRASTPLGDAIVTTLLFETSYARDDM